VVTTAQSDHVRHARNDIAESSNELFEIRGRKTDNRDQIAFVRTSLAIGDQDVDQQVINSLKARDVFKQQHESPVFISESAAQAPEQFPHSAGRDT
jgi:hypothetical protein